ncbi:MAG: hypothetical protein NRZ50_30565 (plasmid) [Bacillus paranthracis]|nr:MAG: hypothetical protein NRZ50_30565 [Bacillus paranthracis]
MPISLNRWENTAQDRNFRNETNENWDKLEKTHNNIEKDSSQALSNSVIAKEQAKEANRISENVQEQINTLVVNGDSSVEAAQARVDVNGNINASLKGRLDKDFINHEKRIVEMNDRSLRTKLGQPGISYAGVIRNKGAGWEFVTDAVHQNINFKNVYSTPNHEIVVEYEPSSKIGAFLATPDETFAAKGITCGASVGDKSALIKCYAPFTGYVDGAGVIATDPIFDGTATSKMMGDGTGLSITYDGSHSNIEKVLVTNIRDTGTTHYGLDIRTARSSKNEIVMRAYHDLYGYVWYDGASWQIASSCIANLSVSFDSASGVLTISHDSMSKQPGYYEFQTCHVEARRGVTKRLIHARTTSVAQSQIQVEFFDHAEERFMTPDPNMRLYFSRPGFKVPHVWATGTRVYFDLGYTIVRPGNLVADTGNLWLLGVHTAK